MSAPRENVLFVPNRNVLLTGSGWGGERARSFNHDPAGPRPVGGIEKSTEEADQANAGGPGTGNVGAAGAAPPARAEAGRRSGGGPWPAGPRVQPQNKPGATRKNRDHSFAGSVPRLRTDTGQRVSGQEAQGEDRPRIAAADHDRCRSMAGAEANRRDGAPVAAAAKLSRRVS